MRHRKKKQSRSGVYAAIAFIALMIFSAAGVYYAGDPLREYAMGIMYLIKHNTGG